MSSREHILQVPVVVTGLRIVQLVVALATLGLAAYGVTYLSFDGDDLTLFTAVCTLIIVVYNLVAAIAVPAMYNYWAILGLDIFGVVFWLVSFALLASEVAAYQIVTYTFDTSSCNYYYAGVCYKKRSLNFLAKRVATTNVYTYRNALAAASGLGGLEFLLFIATLAITGVFLHRHRTAGGHCMPGSFAGGAANAEPKPVELQQNSGSDGQQAVYQQVHVYQQQPIQEQVYQQQPIHAAQQDQQIASA